MMCLMTRELLSKSTLLAAAAGTVPREPEDVQPACASFRLLCTNCSRLATLYDLRVTPDEVHGRLMKGIIVLVLLGAFGWFAYDHFLHDDENPQKIEDPVYAEMRMDVKAGGRELNFALFARMASEDDCRLRAERVWQAAIEGCPTCSIEIRNCQPQLPARYAKLFDDVPIPSTYLSLTRGSKLERDGRLVVYGLTAAEGTAICEQMRQQFARSYTGEIACVPGTAD